MSRKDDADDRNFENALPRQLIRFDNRVSELRQFYESHLPEERKELRDWLEQVNELQQAANWNMNIRIHAENDIFDDNDELIRWADAVFSPETMLSAISKWDQGDNFTPTSVLP